MSPRINTLGEINLLKRLRNFSAVSGIGDDCAILPWTDNTSLLVTTDMLIEEVHFSPQKNSWTDIGEKAMEVNLSDIVAMGGVPLSAFVSLGISGNHDVSVMDDIYKGLGKRGILIQGGDLVFSSHVIINICLLGQVEQSHLVRRHGAKVGDSVAVTGQCGASAVSEYTRIPHARMDESRLLASWGHVTSMTDTSDGLARAVYEIETESQVGISLKMDQIPLATGATLKQALNGGDDYELFFTFTPHHRLPISAQIIGKVIPFDQRTPLIDQGYMHF